jgi:hypothetical protein
MAYFVLYDGWMCTHGTWNVSWEKIAAKDFTLFHHKSSFAEFKFSLREECQIEEKMKLCLFHCKTEWKGHKDTLAL